jgi:hypothetical protein
MFGGLVGLAGGADLPAEIAHIARDPLDPLFDDDAFVADGPPRGSGIKRLAARPDLISGVGNIYADEALWRPGSTATGRATAPPAEVRELLGDARERDEPPRSAGRHVASTRSTSTSTASRATSTGRCTPTAARASPVRGAARRSAGRVHEPVVVPLPRCQPRPRVRRA